MRMGEARSMESTKISGSSSHAYTGLTCQYTDNTNVEPLVILNIDTKCHVINKNSKIPKQYVKARDPTLDINW